MDRQSCPRRIPAGRAGARALERRPRGAFSLVELLVVIAIVALLAALLAPSLGRARQMAIASACKSNMHQLAVGHGLYSGSNDRRLMREAIVMSAHPYEDDPITPRNSSGWVYWPDLLRKFVTDKGVYDCPGVRRLSDYPNGCRRAYGIGVNHIELSYSPWAAWGRQIALVSVRRPSEAFVFADTGKIENFDEPDPDQWVETPAMQFIWCLTPNHGHFAGVNPHRAVNRHLGRTSTAFLDGHAELLPVSEFGFQFFPGVAPDGEPATGESILGTGNDKYDHRWLWGRG